MRLAPVGAIFQAVAKQISNFNQQGPALVQPVLVMEVFHLKPEDTARRQVNAV